MKKSLVSLLMLGFAGGAIAQDLPAFEEVDTNGDGVIDEQEAQAVEGLDFATADLNQDGQIDMSEWQQAQGQ